MMKIGVISDTHIPSKAKVLPRLVMEYFERVDYIFHLGDINEAAVIEALEKLAPVAAVAGNTDSENIKQKYGEKRIVKLGSKTFGLVHGHGAGGKTIDRVRAGFRETKPDCILFGHSHIPYMQYDGGVLFMNPGSPTDKRRNDCYSFGILEVNAEIIPRLVFFDKNGVIQG